MKLAFAIATVTTLHRAAVTRADCDFGSNYTKYYNATTTCSFDVGIGRITLSSESKTMSSGDKNVTSDKQRRNLAFWKVGDKDSTVQCYPNITFDVVSTAYPNGSVFVEASGDFNIDLASAKNATVPDGAPLSHPGLYYLQGGRFDFWSEEDGTWNIIKAEGDIVTVDLCEVLGGGAAAPAPTPTPPTTTPAPSSGQMVAVTTIIPCIAAAMLNYFMFI